MQRAGSRDAQRAVGEWGGQGALGVRGVLDARARGAWGHSSMPPQELALRSLLRLTKATTATSSGQNYMLLDRVFLLQRNGNSESFTS